MDVFCGQCSILDFLPQSSEMRIQNIRDAINIIDILGELLIIYDSALISLKNQDYKCFDPLIGENSCQIRAYMIYFLCLENEGIESLSRINKYREEIQRSLYCISKVKEKLISKNDLFSNDPCISLKNFISINKIDIYFSKKISILLKLYFLSKFTIVNEEGVHTGINYSDMTKELNFSKTLSRRIIHFYQVDISKISCEFIKTLANEIAYCHPHYEPVMDLLICKDDDGRYVLPCYLSMDILLKHMALNKALIVVNVFSSQKNTLDKESIINIFSKLEPTNKIIRAIPEENKNHPCVTFRGISSLTPLKVFNKISTLGIQNILLASTARHPQYPGKYLTSLKNDPFSTIINEGATKKEVRFLRRIRREYQIMREWALQYGCCFEFYSTFFATHIFCDRVSNYMQLNYDKMKLYEYEMAS